MSEEQAEQPAPEPRPPSYPPDELLKHILDNAIDPTTKLKACMALAFMDRCSGHPVDKSEAQIFDNLMSAVMTTPKLSLVKS